MVLRWRHIGRVSGGTGMMCPGGITPWPLSATTGRRAAGCGTAGGVRGCRESQASTRQPACRALDEEKARVALEDAVAHRAVPLAAGTVLAGAVGGVLYWPQRKRPPVPSQRRPVWPVEPEHVSARKAAHTGRHTQAEAEAGGIGAL